MLSCALWPAQLARCRLPACGIPSPAPRAHQQLQHAAPRRPTAPAGAAVRRRRCRPPKAQAPEPSGSSGSSSGSSSSGGDVAGDAAPADGEEAPPGAKAIGQTVFNEAGEEAIVVTEEEVLAAARADMAEQWRDLRAAAVSRLAGGGGPDAPASLTDRLARLATGGFLADAGAGGGERGRQRQGQQQQQPQPAAGAAVDAAVEAVGASAAPTAAAGAADSWQEQQQRRRQDGQLAWAAAADGAAGAAAAAAPLEVVEASVVPPPAAAAVGAGPEAAAADAPGPDEEEGGEGALDVDAVEPWQVPVTSMAALAMAAAAAAVWWPVRGVVWWGLTNGHALETLRQLAFTFPDTPAVMALQMDAFGVWQRGEWGRLLTAGLLHSGVLPALWCIDGLRNAGLWLELACGGAQAAIVLVAAAVGAAAGQLLAGGAPVGLAGAGVTTGAYAAWAVLALTRARGLIPVSSDRGAVILAANAALAWWQPAVGFACLAGGAAGGALGLLLAPALARAAYVAVGLPVAVALVAARLALETGWLAVQLVLRLLETTWRAAVEVVRTVRGL